MVRSTTLQWAPLAIKIAVSAAFFGLILSQAPTVGDFANIFALSPLTVATVTSIILVQMAVISAWRLKLVMHLLGCMLSASSAVRITWSGFFVEQVGAVFVAGDVTRIWLLRQANVALRTATEGPLIDRAIGFATIAAMASLGMPRLWGILNSDQQHSVLHAAGLATGALTAVALLALLSSGLRSRAVRVFTKLRALGISTVRILLASSLPRVTAVVLLALATHSLNVIAIYLLLGAVGVKVGLAVCFVFTPTVLLASMLPVSLSGWGVREGALVLALQSFGVPPEHVLAASVLFGICVLVASLPGGLIWLAIPADRSSSPEDFQGSALMSEPLKLPN